MTHSIPSEMTQASLPQGDATILGAGMDKPWPMIQCVRKLIEAAGILLDDKNYDGQGHELISEARNQAQKYLADFKPESAAVSFPLAKKLWASGYDTGHNHGVGCGHPLAGKCRHDGDKEAESSEDEIRNIQANYTSSSSRPTGHHSDEEWINAGCPST